MPRSQELERELRRAAAGFHERFPAARGLTRAITQRIGREPLAEPPTRRRIIPELALTGLILLVAAGVGVGIARTRSTATQPQSAASVSPSPSATPRALLPQQDLDAAGLTNVGTLVTPENQPGKNGGQGITLIGAYAEPARVVLFFRPVPNAGLPSVSVYDSQGFLNGATSAEPGLAGDALFALDIGPRVSSDGLAHLAITLGPTPDFQGKPSPGDVAFSIAIPIQAATPLPAPAHFPVGSWNVTLEKLEATPSVIHLQAVLAGATPDAIQMSTVTLTDGSGQPLRQVAQSAGITVPKQQLNNSNYANTRINYEWMRPAAGGTYHLRIQGAGGSRTIILTLGPI